MNQAPTHFSVSARKKVCCLLSWLGMLLYTSWIPAKPASVRQNFSKAWVWGEERPPKLAIGRPLTPQRGTPDVCGIRRLSYSQGSAPAARLGGLLPGAQSQQESCA